MKKLFVLVILPVFLFFSCVSNVVFDNSIPLEKTSKIYAGMVGKITEYNGISVNWNYNLVQIPAGDTVLQMDIETSIQVKGALFKYNFQPQKQYYFMINSKNDLLGLDVYAFDYGEKPGAYVMGGTNREWEKHLVAYVPFLNVRPRGSKTVLE